MDLSHFSVKLSRHCAWGLWTKTVCTLKKNNWQLNCKIKFKKCVNAHNKIIFSYIKRSAYLECHCWNASVKNPMDPFPSDTSVTSGENRKINNLLKFLEVVLRAYRIWKKSQGNLLNLGKNSENVVLELRSAPSQLSIKEAPLLIGSWPRRQGFLSPQLSMKRYSISPGGERCQHFLYSPTVGCRGSVLGECDWEVTVYFPTPSSLIRWNL